MLSHRWPLPTNVTPLWLVMVHVNAALKLFGRLFDVRTRLRGADKSKHALIGILKRNEFFSHRMRKVRYFIEEFVRSKYQNHILVINYNLSHYCVKNPLLDVVIHL